MKLTSVFGFYSGCKLFLTISVVLIIHRWKLPRSEFFIYLVDITFHIRISYTDTQCVIPIRTFPDLLFNESSPFRSYGNFMAVVGDNGPIYPEIIHKSITRRLLASSLYTRVIVHTEEDSQLTR